MSEINIDITKLSGYEDLPDGTYNIAVVAKGDPNYYVDSDPSNSVSYVVPTYLINYSLTNVSAHGAQINSIAAGDTVTVIFDIDQYYKMPLDISQAVSVTNATAGSFTSISDNQFSFTLSNASGPVSVSITAELISYTVTYNLTNITKSESSPTVVYANALENINIQLNSDAGYTAATSSAITISNATLSNYSDEGTYCTFKLTNITGNISITASTTTYYNYPITVVTTGLTPGQSNPTTINIGAPVTLQFTSIAGYKVPEYGTDIVITNATKETYTKTSDTSCSLVISNPTGDVGVGIAGIGYSITYNLTGVKKTTSSPTEWSGNSVNVVLYTDPAEGKNVPSNQDITVAGATKSNYSSSNCLSCSFTLSNPTGDISITTSGVTTSVTYITFSSVDGFSLGMVDRIKYWDGSLEYSTDTETWTTWDGTSDIFSVSAGDQYNICLRGSNNTYITGGYYNINGFKLTSTGINGISCKGNIENLLDYISVSNNIHPAMSQQQSCYGSLFLNCDYLTSAPELPAITLTGDCYNSMFQGCSRLLKAPALPATTVSYAGYQNMFKGCTSLKETPKLPATTLNYYCYNGMFLGCTSLETLPELPATTLFVNCYGYMFSDCTKIALSTTQSEQYPYSYRIPVSGTGTDPGFGANSALYHMFMNAGDIWTPQINTTYYTNAKIAPLDTPSISLSVNTLTIVDNSGRADSFDIYVDGVCRANVVTAQQGNTTFDLSTISGIVHGQYTVTVRAKKSGYVDSAASNSVEWAYLPKQRLPAPTNISFDDSTNIVTFDRVEYALKYKLYDTGGPLIGEIPQQMTATVSYNIANLSNFSALSVAGIHWLYLVACGDPNVYDDSYNSAIFLYVSMPTVSLGLSGSVLTVSVEHSNLDNYIDYYTLYADESGNVMSRNIYSATYDLSEWLTTPGTYSVYVKVHFDIQEGRYSPYSSSVSYVVAPPSTGYVLSFSNDYSISDTGSVEQCALYVTYANGTVAEVPLEPEQARGTSYNSVASLGLHASDSTYLDYTMNGVSDYLYTVDGDGTLTLSGDCTITYCDGQECIAADTLVLMADGTQKQLGEIHTGDYILSYDWNTMQLVPNKVIYSSCEEPDWNTGGWDVSRYFKRTFSDGTVIKQAFAHRFYNREQQKFVYLEQWSLGQHTYAYNNGQGKLVEYVNSEKVYQPLRFARITGENGTNYFANGLLTGDRHCPRNIILPPEES